MVYKEQIYIENVKVFYIKFNGYDESFNKFFSKKIVDFKDFPKNITDFYLWFSDEYAKSIIPPTFRMMVALNDFDFVAVYDKQTVFNEKEINQKLKELNIPYLHCSYGTGDITFREYHKNNCCEMNEKCLCKEHAIFNTRRYNETVHKMMGTAVYNAIKHKQFPI